MTTTSTSDIKGKLVAVVERAETDLAALVTQLSDAEKAAIGKPDHWAVKDQIAHLNFWRDDGLRRLIALRDGTAEPAPIEEDDDIVNGRNFAKHQHTPWSEVLGESNRILREAKQVIEQLTEAQLTEAQQSESGVKIARSERLVTNILEHPSEHLAHIYRERGNLARAKEQERATVQVIGDLFGRNSTIYGYASYNLGCFYARNGEAEQAIAAVGEALPLIPSLVEWSRQDPDLASVRELPAFQALYSR